jgi:hypothetical protein
VFSKRVGVQLQGIRPQLLLPDEVVRIFYEIHLPEHPRVVEGKVVTVLEGEEHAAVRKLVVRVFEVRQVPGHTEVREHPPAVVELHNEVLVVTPGRLEDAPFRAPSSSRGRFRRGPPRFAPRQIVFSGAAR